LGKKKVGGALRSWMAGMSCEIFCMLQENVGELGKEKCLESQDSISWQPMAVVEVNTENDIKYDGAVYRIHMFLMCILLPYPRILTSHYINKSNAVN